MPQRRRPLQGRLDAITSLSSVLGLQRRKEEACRALSFTAWMLSRGSAELHRLYGPPSEERSALARYKPALPLHLQLHLSHQVSKPQQDKGQLTCLSCSLLYLRLSCLLQARILAGRNHLSAFIYLRQHATCFALNLLPSSTALTLLQAAFYVETLLMLCCLVC